MLHSCAELLLQKEKIGREEFEALFAADGLVQNEGVSRLDELLQ